MCITDTLNTRIKDLDTLRNSANKCCKQIQNRLWKKDSDANDVIVEMLHHRLCQRLQMYEILPTIYISTNTSDTSDVINGGIMGTDRSVQAYF